MKSTFRQLTNYIYHQCSVLFEEAQYKYKAMYVEEELGLSSSKGKCLSERKLCTGIFVDGDHATNYTDSEEDPLVE